MSVSTDTINANINANKAEAQPVVTDADFAEIEAFANAGALTSV